MLVHWLCKDGHGVFSHNTLREASARIRAREFAAIALAWKPGGPEGISDWDEMGWVTRQLVAVVATVAEGEEAAAWCKGNLPSTLLHLVHAPEDRLDTTEMQRACDRIRDALRGGFPTSP